MARGKRKWQPVQLTPEQERLYKLGLWAGPAVDYVCAAAECERQGRPVPVNVNPVTGRPKGDYPRCVECLRDLVRIEQEAA